MEELPFKMQAGSVTFGPHRTSAQARTDVPFGASEEIGALEMTKQ
jgi:hypothetical protein